MSVPGVNVQTAATFMALSETFTGSRRRESW